MTLKIIESTKSRNSDFLVSHLQIKLDSEIDILVVTVGPRVGIREHTDCVSQKPHLTSFSEIGRLHKTSNLRSDVYTQRVRYIISYRDRI